MCVMVVGVELKTNASEISLVSIIRVTVVNDCISLNLHQFAKSTPLLLLYCIVRGEGQTCFCVS